METAALARVIAGLFLVISAILVCAWLARRYGLAGQNPTTKSRLRITASLALGARHRVSIIEVEGTRLLVGITPQGITLLHTFPEAIHADTVDTEQLAQVSTSSIDVPEAGPNTFQHLLRHWLQSRQS